MCAIQKSVSPKFIELYIWIGHVSALSRGINITAVQLQKHLSLSFGIEQKIITLQFCNIDSYCQSTNYCKWQITKTISIKLHDFVNTGSSLLNKYYYLTKNSQFLHLCNFVCLQKLLLLCSRQILDWTFHLMWRSSLHLRQQGKTRIGMDNQCISYLTDILN